MFEELYALAVLYANGFDTGEQFQNLLNEMTLQGRKDMLELQFMPLKDAVIRTMSMADHGAVFDPDVFGQFLMQYIREKWRGKTLDFLGEHLYALWRALPESLHHKMPFELFVYAGDEADYCKESLLTEEKCRSWFESVFNYYENGKKLSVGVSLASQLEQ